MQKYVHKMCEPILCVLVPSVHLHQESLQQHHAIGDDIVGDFDEMFAYGITLLKPNGVSPNQDVENEGHFEEEALPAIALPT